jgi:hypothetical protein
MRLIWTGTPLLLPDGTEVEVFANTYPDDETGAVIEVAVRDPHTRRWLRPAVLTHTETDQ